MEATQVPKRPRTGNDNVDHLTFPPRIAAGTNSIESNLADIGYILREILVRQSVLEDSIRRIENALSHTLPTNKRGANRVDKSRLGNSAYWRRSSPISKSPSTSPGSRVYDLRRRASPIPIVKKTKNVSFRPPDCYDKDPDEGKLMDTKLVLEKVKRFNLASPKIIVERNDYEGHSERKLRKSTSVKRKATEENDELVGDQVNAGKGREFKRGVRRVFTTANLQNEPEPMDMNYEM